MTPPIPPDLLAAAEKAVELDKLATDDWKTDTSITVADALLLSGEYVIAKFPPRLTPGGKFLHNGDVRFIAFARTALPQLAHLVLTLAKSQEDAKAESDSREEAIPELERLIRVAVACGEPDKVNLYDEECVEGWRWTSPDGQEWEEVGDWSEEPPIHPLLSAALTQLEKENQ